MVCSTIFEITPGSMVKNQQENGTCCKRISKVKTICKDIVCQASNLIKIIPKSYIVIFSIANITYG